MLYCLNKRDKGPYNFSAARSNYTAVANKTGMIQGPLGPISVMYVLLFL